MKDNGSFMKRNLTDWQKIFCQFSLCKKVTNIFCLTETYQLFYRKEWYWMAKNFLWLVTLQENSKTDEDHEVIINFLCTTCIMKYKILNFCLIVESDILTEKWKEILKKYPWAKHFFCSTIGSYFQFTKK